jgi:hypothetical protein
LQASRARNASNSLIIVAGLGTTGTTAIEVALVRLGLSTAKWNHVVRPAGWTPGVSKPKCSSPTRAFHAMHRLLRQGIGLHTRVQSFRLYDDVDAVLDSPAIDYLPFLLQAYPRSRLILTTRDSAEWARRRAREHKCTPAPFQLWFGAPEDNRSNLYLGPCRPTPRHVLEHSFNAWNRSPAQCHATAHCIPYACLPVASWQLRAMACRSTPSTSSGTQPLCPSAAPRALAATYRLCAARGPEGAARRPSLAAIWELGAGIRLLWVWSGARATCERVG